MGTIVASAGANVNSRPRAQRGALKYRRGEIGRQQQDEYETRFKQEGDDLAARMDAEATKAAEKVIQEGIDADAKAVVGREKRERRDDNDASAADVEGNNCHKRVR